MTLAPDESASKSLEVTLAQEDPRLGVLPDPDRRSEFILLSHLTPKINLIETCYCLVILTTYPGSLSGGYLTDVIHVNMTSLGKFDSIIILTEQFSF